MRLFLSFAALAATIALTAQTPTATSSDVRTEGEWSCFCDCKTPEWATASAWQADETNSVIMGIYDSYLREEVYFRCQKGNTDLNVGERLIVSLDIEGHHSPISMFAYYIGENTISLAFAGARKSIAFDGSSLVEYYTPYMREYYKLNPINFPQLIGALHYGGVMKATISDITGYPIVEYRFTSTYNVEACIQIKR